jgi:hypothetical protein
MPEHRAAGEELLKETLASIDSYCGELETVSGDYYRATNLKFNLLIQLQNSILTSITSLDPELALKYSQIKSLSAMINENNTVQRQFNVTMFKL